MKNQERPAVAKHRVFLFLQGPSSPLFAKIAAKLEAADHVCLRINLNVGDWVFWRRRNAINYRGREDKWPAFIQEFLLARNVTDLILLGEERPYHKVATAAARDLGVDVHVVEMGYLRPDWVTFERDGMSSNSKFPRDPETLASMAKNLPEPDWRQCYDQTFLAEASYDLLYNLPNVLVWYLFPYYKRHAIFHPLTEYYGWFLRLLRSKGREAYAAKIVQRLLVSADAVPFYVYPLQLQTDYQLRAHSDFCGQEAAIETVIRSFSRHAPDDSRLLIKIHPLDNGLINWASIINNEARANEVISRIDLIDGGRLDLLIEKTRGLVTVNSTAALPALRVGKPVKVLGKAIYDIEGIAEQQSLDRFWQSSEPPVPELVAAFFQLLASDYQVRGNFYSKEGSDAAAAEISRRLAKLQAFIPPGGGVDHYCSDLTPSVHRASVAGHQMLARAKTIGVSSPGVESCRE